MKKLLYPIISLIVLALTACSSEYDKLLTDAGRAVKPESDGMLYATIEETGGGEAQTKVYADEDMLVLWNANDRISAFVNNAYNQPYQFKGKDGDNAGGFAKVQTGGEPATSTPLDHIYAVYPYVEATSISNSGILSVELPAEQHYLAHSFGKGANTMVSVTDGNMLLFKNAGGYLSFKFYGDGARVKSISLKGNNHEKLAGKAAITMAAGGLPAVKMQNDATEEITLTCADPVALGVDSEHYKEFWFVIPPTTFAQGFTVTVTDANGGVFAKTTSKSITVSRNKLNRMAPIEVVQASSSHESVDLGLPSGLKWATCNVGAESPEEYGDYFAWGETEPKESYSWSTYKWCNGSKNSLTKYNNDSTYGAVDYKTVLEMSDDAAHINWGDKWRMPTREEWRELTTECEWLWTNQNGKNGYLVTGKNGNSIFIPAAGDHYDTYLENAGIYGIYWSTTCKSSTSKAFFMVTHSDHFYSGDSDYRFFGFSIRPVYGDPVSVSDVSLNKAEVTLYVGRSTQLEATVLPANAHEKGVIWSSSNPAAASISKDGMVTANQAGNAVITATTLDGGFRATCQVTIKAPQQPKYVDLGLPSGLKWATFNVGANGPEETGDYFAWGETSPKDIYSWSTYKWCNGSSNTLTKYNNDSAYGAVDNKTVLDSSDDAAYANWGNKWRIPTVEEWDELRKNCTLIWTTNNGLYGHLVTGQNGNSIFLSTGSYWTSSLITTLPEYAWEALVDESFNDGFNAKFGFFRYASRSVRAVYDAVSVSSISLDKSDISLSVDKNAQLNATVLPENAGEKGVTWSSSNPSVASVSTSGLVTAVSPGTATITVTTVDGGFKATCLVTVKAPQHPECVDLGLPSGLKWATFNVGASYPEEYGDYFAWGETETKDNYSWSTYKWCNGSASTLTKYNTSSSYGTVDSNTQLDLSDDAARANWGGKWRMPTDAEWEELRTKCIWTWTTQNGKKGRLVTGPNGNSIFLPAAGRRHGTNLDDTDSYGGYWSSSLTMGYPFDAYFVRINLDGVVRDYFDRFYGRSVRPVYDEQTSTPIQISDAHFKAYLLYNFDTDHDGAISAAEADAVTEIKVCTDTIASLKGIEYFKNLSYLSCKGTVTWDANLKKEIINGLLTELDIRNNTALTLLNCFGNQLTQLDITHNAALISMNCGYNQLTSLNISNNSQLRWLRCTTNQLASLNVSNNAALYSLDCSRNQLTELNINKNIELQSLECYENRLSVLDVSSNSKLEFFACGHNFLQTLDVRNNRNLLELDCADNLLSALNLENNLLLTNLICDTNYMTSLDVHKLTALTHLGCDYNLLTRLDVSELTALTYLSCEKNQLTELDVSKLTALTQLSCGYNYFPSLDVSNNLLLDTLRCYDSFNNPHISEIWLKTGQTIRTLYYNSYLTQLKYK